MSTFVYVDGEGDAFAGRPGRKPVQRRTVDYTATTVRHVEVRPVAIATSATVVISCHLASFQSGTLRHLFLGQSW